MKTIYDTVHVTVIDTVHRVIADSVTIEALKSSQQFYNDSYVNLIAVGAILVTLVLAAYVGQYFTIRSQAGKLLRKANEQALEMSTSLLASAKEEIDVRSNELEDNQTVISARMATTHALIGAKYCGEGDFWLGLFHYSLYCDICVENGLTLSDDIISSIKDAIANFPENEPHGEILLSLIDARKYSLSNQDEKAYGLIIEIFNSQYERYGRGVIEDVIQKARDELGVSEHEEPETTTINR